MSAAGMTARWWRKLRALLRREQFGGELDEEMQFHCEEAARELEAQGMSREEARYAALRQFGNATRLRERSAEVMGFRWETVAQDVRFAVRQMGRNPGFAVTAVLMLALGMGASTAIFGFVDAALIQPLPYGQPNRLVAVDESEAVFPRSNLSRYDYEDWKRMNDTLASLDVYGGTGYLLRMGPVAEPVPAARVSAGFFHTLGVQPMLGRDFRPGEDQPGQAKIVLLPYGTWQTRFGGRRDVIGQQVSLSGDEYTIVGVLPRSFSFAPRANAEFWVPLLDRNGCETRRSCHNLDGVARLKPGVTEQAALANLKNVSARLAAEYPGSNKGQGASVEPLTELIVGKVRPILLTLLAGAGLLLLIACVNVASLLLVRAEKRRREIAVRGALGATRARLVRQFVTEGLLLAVAGCAGGLFVAGGLMTLLTHIVPKAMAEGMPFLSVAGLNAHTLLFAGGVALLAAGLLAAIPALRMQLKDLHEGLGEGARGAAGRLWRRLGANLVVVELAVAVVLLAGAGLLGKSLYRLLHVNLGFDATHLATAYVMATGPGYAKPEQQMNLYREIQRRVGALPGVTGVAITSDLPIQCNCDTDWIRIPGKPFHGEHNEVVSRDVSPDYLSLLRVKLLEGRMFTDEDNEQHPNVTIINESLAKKYFPGEDALGKQIGNTDLKPDSMREVVGVIADIREGALDDPPWPAEYLPIYHSPETNFSAAARTSGDAEALLPEMMKAMREISPNPGVYGEVTMEEQASASPTAMLHRFSTWLVGGFAAMALVLCVVGLYGVVAYSVSQRTREIGIRMALGAERAAVHRLILKEAGRLSGIGILAGLGCAVGAAVLMKSLLFGVAAWDVPTLAAVAAVLGVSALVASYLPARRAAGVNPVEALRSE
ncbi:MAG TPA: ABC transporter permease [Acidobacteriaceae bacterium]|jgi:predicted permease|nr:ABC transporter permease [Acidobacteriaceae bacterium]